MVSKASRRRLPDRGQPHVLIIIQNLPVPLDRRVWLECQALIDAGYLVSVICPKGPDDPSHQIINGINIYKYRPFAATTERKLAFVAEYVYSFIVTARLMVKAWRRNHFDVIQTCNPPDIFWPLLALARKLTGSRSVFDQHDLCPELFESRWPSGALLPYLGLRLLERCTYRVADHVIATNGSYRATALGRGRKRPEDVTIVRSGPDPDRLRRQDPDPALRRGRRHLVSYLGVMGPQDGVDIVIQAADLIVRSMGRQDISFTLIGGGDCLDNLIRQCHELGLDDYVQFTGRAPDELVFRVFSTSDLGLSPDPWNPLNDVSTMNKTMEYMAFELPVVAFDLRETRVSAGEAAVYVTPNDVALYARAIVELLDDEARRRTMGALGRARVESVLAWSHQRRAYVEVYDRLLKRNPEAASNVSGGAGPTASPAGNGSGVSTAGNGTPASPPGNGSGISTAGKVSTAGNGPARYIASATSYDSPLTQR